MILIQEVKIAGETSKGMCFWKELESVKTIWFDDFMKIFLCKDIKEIYQTEDNIFEVDNKP